MRAEATWSRRADRSDLEAMPIGRAERRAARKPRVAAVFGDRTEIALDLLDLTEQAWHDSYREVSLPDTIVDDLLFLSGGRIEGLIESARLAVIDWRDLKMAAQTKRERSR